MARDDVLHAPLNDLLHPLGHPRHDQIDEALLVGDLEATATLLVPTAVLMRTIAARVVVMPVAVMMVFDRVAVMLQVMPSMGVDLAMLMGMSMVVVVTVVVVVAVVVVVVVVVTVIGCVGELLLRVGPSPLPR